MCTSLSFNVGLFGEAVTRWLGRFLWFLSILAVAFLVFVIDAIFDMPG